MTTVEPTKTKWNPRAKRKPRDKQKFNSAVKGKVFLSRPDLETRWGIGPITVKTRLSEGIDLGLIAPMNLSNQMPRYALSEIEKYEDYKRIRGLEIFRKQKAEREARKATKLAKAVKINL